MPNTIVLRGKGIRKEADVQAANTITPGHLIERHTDGTVRPHTTAGAAAPARHFAVENELAGKGIDDTYAAGERCLFESLVPGCEVYAWLADANNAAIGAALESGDNGELRVHVPQADTDGVGTPDIVVGQIVARALEAVDTTGGATAPARIKVEIV